MGKKVHTTFDEVVLRNRDLIWHVCTDYSLGAAWTVDDAFQEVLSALWEDYGQFEGRSAESTWVYRVATNTMLDLKRRPANRPQPLLNPEIHALAVDPAEDDGYRYLLQLFEQLDPVKRRIVRARCDGYSLRQTAAIVRLPVSTVYREFKLAKQIIRKQYEERF